MIELPTPETDALFWRNGYPVEVDSSKAMQLCEKLEQERDWITEKFKLLEGCFKRAERERDEARAEWGKASMDAAQLLSEKTKVMAERDEAREAVRLASIEAKALATSIQKSEYSDVKFELCDSVAGVISQIDNMYAGVREQRDEARKQLRVAVGLISTTPQFQDQHPEEVLRFVEEGAKWK